MTTTTNEEAKTGCAMIIATFALAPFSMMWRGYVLTKLWAWFVVTRFSIPMIDLPSAIGLAVTVHFLTYQNIRTPKDERPLSEQMMATILSMALLPAFVLFIGWIVNHWMAK